MCPVGCPSIYGERQEHTLGWEEGKEFRTDKHHWMDFGKTLNPKRRLIPAWISPAHGSYSKAIGLLGQMYQSLEGTWDTCSTYLNTLRAQDDPCPSVGNDGSQQEV